jgi:hypothetical protein
MTFVFYAIVGLSFRNAFNRFVLEDGPAIASTADIFQLCNPDSTGYGDIVPYIPWPAVCAILKRLLVSSTRQLCLPGW